ncbi:MAG: epsilon-lactone hydrolase [Clostridiales bacterium]|nr:epsilon-lactone hydrolase [Clostridiales bacterium]
MQSIRSKLLLGVVRHRHLLKGQLKRPVIDKHFSVADFREGIDKASVSMNKRLIDALITPVDIDGMYGEIIALKSQPLPEEKIILYIHGGGFISGSCHTHRAHVYKFVKETGAKALVFDYRLAPEHPYPAATDDCLSAYKWLVEMNGYHPDNIVIAGESAGATLTLVTLLRIKAARMAQPAGAAAISPVTDLRSLADSFKRNAPKDIAPYNSWHVWQGFYMGETEPMTLFVSPIFGELDGLAPIYLCIGTYEIHYDDTVNFHERVLSTGGSSEIKIYEKMVHAFPIMAPMFPEATAALKDICRFLSEKLCLR